MSLIKYDAACRALQEAVAVDEVKDLRDKADAMRIYAMQAKNKSLEVDAAEIRIRAERRLGEMIAAQKADGGLNPGSAGSGINQHTLKEVRSSVTTAPKLSDVGISKDLSSRAQKLAAVPAAEFEAEVGEWRERVQAEGVRVTTRLEKAGERATNEQASQPAVDDGSEASDAEEAFLAQYEKESQIAYNALIEVAHADDKLAAALLLVDDQAKEIARLKALVQTLEERRNGLMNRCNENIRQINSLRKKLDQAQKESA